MAVNFFNPASSFGDISGWEIQSENPTTAFQRASALGADGDEVSFQTYDEKISVSCNYVATQDGASIPSVGSVINGWHVDSVSVTLSNTAFATMTISGHKHGSASHGTTREYSSSFGSFPCFGCPASVVGLTLPSGVGVRSVTYSLQCNHVDELGSSGEFLAGDNYDGSESVSVELCGVGSISAAQGWTISNKGETRGNTAAETASATAERHLAHS